MRIDAHQHFWIFNEDKDSWITPAMHKIKRNFLPNDISQTLKSQNFDGVIAVQADQSTRETDFLLELSSVYALIKGIVGWVDLRSPVIEEHLENYAKFPKIKGFRHIVEAESNADFLHTDEFLRGISYLTKWEFTYDLLINSSQFDSAIKCVSFNTKQKFVLDHMAKPQIGEPKEEAKWKTFIEELAAFPNVYCKISGLTTLSDWDEWKVADFRSYILHIIRCFGINRIIFGSDWPVCLLAGSFMDSEKMIQDNSLNLTEDELKGFWGDNATSFYKLS